MVRFQQKCADCLIVAMLGNKTFRACTIGNGHLQK
jgi:hypothetical protein